ncbi:MAG TPA: transcriptional repressor [Gammaproteobacteria bacterium]|nr:transcriptional repressor [Gammaproteobacteria bacterium]
MDKALITALLEKHDILPTSQRVEIAALMLSQHQHMSADQVLAHIREGGETAVSKATVYNTLGLFAEKGLLREVIVDPAKVFYDSNTKPHHHFYNVDDGSLIDFDAADCAISQLPEPPAGTVAEGVEVIVRIRQNRPATAN